MATNCTFNWTETSANGVSSNVSKVISLADVVVQTTPTAVGTFNTATVTADKARSHQLAASDGVSPGRYEKVAEPDVFRKLQ